MLIDKGKRHMATGEYEKALKVSLKVLEIKPGSPAGLMLQGDALKNLDKRKDAARAYLEATKEAKLYLEPIKKLAEFFKEEGDMEQELKYLEQLDKLSPLNVERKVDIGGLNIKMGNSDMAKEVFDQAIHLTQRQIAGMLSNVTKYIAEQCMESSPELAEEYLRQSLDAKKDMLTKADVETFNTLGLALRRQGRWEDAVKEYTKALKVAPEDENLHYNMAMAYVDGRSYRQAEAMVDKVLNLNEDFGAESEIVCFNIAYIFLIVKKQKKALEFFQKTLAINPENAEAQKMVKKLMSETNAA
jgi:tetratricopeptide (TPR) repeat protein